MNATQAKDGRDGADCYLSLNDVYAKPTTQSAVYTRERIQLTASAHSYGRR